MTSACVPVNTSARRRNVGKRRFSPSLIALSWSKVFKKKALQVGILQMDTETELYRYS